MSSKVVHRTNGKVGHIIGGSTFTKHGKITKHVFVRWEDGTEDHSLTGSELEPIIDGQYLERFLKMPRISQEHFMEKVYETLQGAGVFSDPEQRVKELRSIAAAGGWDIWELC